MSKVPHFYTRWTVPHDPPSEVGTFSMTSQEFAEDADINVLYKRFMDTGLLPQGERTPSFGVFDPDFDYADMRRMINEANDYFIRLPSDVRDKYGNDPEQFFEALNRGEVDLQNLTTESNKASSGTNIPENVETAPTTENNG